MWPPEVAAGQTERVLGWLESPDALPWIIGIALVGVALMVLAYFEHRRYQRLDELTELYRLLRLHVDEAESYLEWYRTYRKVVGDGKSTQ